MKRIISILLTLTLLCGLFSLVACDETADSSSSEPADKTTHTHSYPPPYDFSREFTAREYCTECCDYLLGAVYTGDHSVSDDTIILRFEVTNNFWGDFEGDSFYVQHHVTCLACLKETFKGDTVQLFDTNGKAKKPIFEKGKEYLFLAHPVTANEDLPCLSWYLDSAPTPIDNDDFYGFLPYIDNAALYKIDEAEILHPDGKNGYYHLADYFGTYFEESLEEFEELYIYDQ